LFTFSSDSDELLPQKGKDEEYDAIVAEINGIERELEEALAELMDQVGYVMLRSNLFNLYPLFGRCIDIDIDSSSPTGIVQLVTRYARAGILLCG
jgi:hypothetical protein